MGATSRVGSAYPSGVPPVFGGVRVAQSLVFLCCFLRTIICLFLIAFLAIALSDLFLIYELDCSSGIFHLSLR